VIGIVKVDTTNQGIYVSVTTITIRHVLSDNIHLVIPAIGVILVHQIHTTQRTIHVIGTVIVGIISQGTLVSVIITITPVA
jgi:hypothetical protein